MAFDLKKAWSTCANLPFGKKIFSQILSQAIPYTGTIHPMVLELREGYSRVEIKDRRMVRNHLDSIHAIALMNLGEFSTGLAVSMALPPGGQVILVELSMKYFKKARGSLIAEAKTTIPETLTDGYEWIVESSIFDAQKICVAQARAVWNVRIRGKDQ